MTTAATPADADPAVTDDVGHEWRPLITPSLVRMARDYLHLDLHRLTQLSPELVTDRITSDRRAMGVLLYSSVELQAAEYRVGGEAFARLMKGRDGSWRVLSEFVVAFAAALAAFYPNSHFGRSVGAGQALLKLLKQG